MGGGGEGGGYCYTELSFISLTLFVTCEVKKQRPVEIFSGIVMYEEKTRPTR